MKFVEDCKEVDSDNKSGINFNFKPNDSPQKILSILEAINLLSEKVTKKYENRKYTTLESLPFDFDIFLPKTINFFSESTVKKSFINVNLLPHVNVIRQSRK